MRPLVAGCVALIVLGAVANVLLWRSRQTAAQRHENARREGEALIRTLSNRPRIDADLAALRSALAEIDRNLADEQSMEVNLGYFYRLERNARVRLARLNQLAAPASPSSEVYKSVPFSMQVTGSYRNNLNFLRALETGPRLLRVRHCSFERLSGDNADVTVDLTVDVLTRP